MDKNGKKINIEDEEACMKCLQKELRKKFAPERKDLCVEIMRRHHRATKHEKMQELDDYSVKGLVT